MCMLILKCFNYQYICHTIISDILSRYFAAFPELTRASAFVPGRIKSSDELTYCGLETPYGDTDLS